MHNNLLRLLCDSEGDIRDAKAMQCMPSVFHRGIQAGRWDRGREASRRQSRRRQSPKRRVVPSDPVKHDLTKAEGGPRRHCLARKGFRFAGNSAIDENVSPIHNVALSKSCSGEPLPVKISTIHCLLTPPRNCLTQPHFDQVRGAVVVLAPRR